MRILLDGAAELRLTPAYVAQLEAVPVQRVGPVLHWLAVHHFYFSSLLFRLKAARLVRGYSKALFAVYVPSTSGRVLAKALSAVATAVILAPTALVGALVRATDAARGRPVPPMLAALMEKRPDRAPATGAA